MTMKRLTVLFILTLALIGLSNAYNIGLGRADATGPCVEIAFVSLTSKSFEIGFLVLFYLFEDGLRTTKTARSWNSH